MKNHPSLAELASIFLVLFIIFSFNLLVTCSFAEQPSAFVSGGIAKSPRAKAVDEEAKKKLRQMSPEEVRLLDKKLAEALTLYYERDYARALPIFKEISDKVETMDVMFWLATCAQRAGDVELAIKKYKKMLEIDPSLHRVRLELATAYYQSGEYDLAKTELKEVLKSNPPEPVKQNIKKLLARIEEQTRRLYTNLRFSLGIQADSNVNAAPDRQIIGTPGGGIIELGKTQKELSDWVGVIDFAGNALYDFGDRNGLMWNTTGSFYQTHNTTHHEFDFTFWRVSTGPWWVTKRGVLKLPGAFGKSYYGHDSLYKSYDFAPSYEFFFTRKVSIKGAFAYIDDSYYPSEREGQDNINRIYSIGPNFYFNNQKDIISIFFSWENLNAESRGYSYDAYNLGFSYYKKLPWDMEAYARYKYSNRDFKGQPLSLFGWDEDRQEWAHNAYAAFSKTFFKYFNATLYFNWIYNNSNTPLYEFSKTIYGLSVGAKF